jgi:hypothetical protein
MAKSVPHSADGGKTPGVGRGVTSAETLITDEPRKQMAGDGADLRKLRGDLARLHAGIAHWTPARWSARTADGRTRADVLFTLVTDLAMLGARAGCGAPAGTMPPRLGAHALADQLAVVGAELVAAPGAADLAAEADAAVTSVRRLLTG